MNAVEKSRQEVRAFAPAHIACIIRTYKNQQPESTGALGVGFTIDKGVTVTVSKNQETKIIINNQETSFDTVKQVIAMLTDTPVCVNITSDVPFGKGFGMSGASALGTAYALNELLNLHKKSEELALIAHISEVENSTGLGDVSGQYHGGFVIRTKQEDPLYGERLRIKNQDIYFKVYGEIDTKAVLANKKRRDKIKKAGDHALKQMTKQSKKNSLHKVIDISKAFAQEAGLLKSERILRDIEEIEAQGGKASMIMLSEAVFSTIPLEGYNKATITTKSVRLL